MPSLTRLLTLLLLALLSLTVFPTLTVAADPPRYTDNLDGTVTDTTTGAVWKRYAEGVTCSGETSEYN